MKISEVDVTCKIDENWDKKFERLWDLDSVGIRPDEESVYERYESEDIKFVNSRYEVKMPFNESHPVIRRNYRLSEKRLYSLKDNLKKKPGLMEKYDAVIKQQIKEEMTEIIEPDEKEPPDGSVAYHPHFPVLKDEKSTKLRIVFDLSCKVNGSSLNDCFYKGPCTTPLIINSLMIFRYFNIAITADIEKAYLQISVHPQHRDFLRFLWFDDIKADNPEIIKLRFRRVLFGAVPSQHLLNSVICKHLEQYKETDPEFVKKMKHILYVDDLPSGASNVDEGKVFYEKSKSRFTEGQFNLREWRTSSAELRDFINKEECTAEENMGEKVLGLIWDEIKDVLIMNFEKLVDKCMGENITKRLILKIMASCYDPLGLAQPLIVQMKIIFQEVCKLNLKWDEEVPENLKKKWNDMVNEIRNLGNLVFPRCYCNNEIENPIKEIEIIGFSDASFTAYGCCVYFKFIKANGEIKVSLVTAKSRIAPLKAKLTIPRLELMGALLLSRLISSVDKCFSQYIQFEKRYCYTDSMICLSWIQAISKEFKTFVQNRVIEIREKVKQTNWFYVPTDMNPADIITRLNTRNMSNQMWVNGPSFLYNSSNSQKDTHDADADEKNVCEWEEFNNELKKKEVTLTTVVLPSLGNIIRVENYSNILKLFRVTAYVLRFIKKLKKKENGHEINSIYCSAEEIANARLLWVKENQKYLTQNRNFEQMKIQLNIVVDEDKIWRVHGRMKNACLNLDAKAPVVISKNHYLSKLIVEHCHLKVFHNGVKQTIVEIRSRYYVSKIRQFVKKCLRLCITCKKINSRPIQYPSHSDLPKFRFDDSKPFNSVGIDYLGPLMVLSVFPPHDMLRKVHVALYTCASTRGVFLDVVESLSSGTFINSLRRFVAERGVPRLIVSDNGTAFKAAETQSFVSDRGISWKFNLEASPWWGGFFESMVKSVKSCLKKILGLKRISYVELETILKEIQVILNNRPLTEPVDEDVEFLTPNSILFGRRLQMSNDHVSSDEIQEESTPSYGKRVKYLQSIINIFWKMWRQEYLIALRDFHAKGNSKIAGVLELDDLVIVEDKKLPRHRWKMGRVTELIKGSDNVLRGARVLLGSTRSIIGRPLNKLCRLELNANRTEQSWKWSNNSKIDNQVNVTDCNLDHDASTQSENTDVINSSTVLPENNEKQSRIRREASVRSEILTRKQLHSMMLTQESTGGENVVF